MSNVAEAMAADLAGARVDPNEAQKALAYLRSKRDPKGFFDYLQAVVANGQVVIRSRQTLDYYRSLQQICLRHLRGMEYEEMAQTLGWALRLLRYYRAVPEAVQRQTAAPEPRRQPQAAAPEPKHEPQKEGPTIPAVGEVFAGLVLERDDELVVIEVPGFTRDKAVAVLKVEPDTPRWREGKDRARCEVIGQRERDGLTILRVKWSKAAPRPKDG